MTQKVLKVGSSAAVTIPKKSLKELGLKLGDEVVVEIDVQDKKMVIHAPTKKPKNKENDRVAKLTLDFINRYRKDLEALARK